MGVAWAGRSTAAIVAGVTAVVYGMIGLRVVFIGTTEDGGSGPIPPMLLAAALSAALMVLLVASSGRWVLVFGIALELTVVMGYFALASVRSPSFEAWGLSLKAIQIALLAVLVGLLVRELRTGRTAPSEPSLDSRSSSHH